MQNVVKLVVSLSKISFNDKDISPKKGALITIIKLITYNKNFIDLPPNDYPIF